MKSEGKKAELPTYRLVLLGDAGVGKSAITVRYLCGRFLHEYDPTLEDCYEKEETIDDHSMKIQIFDTAGQDGTSSTGKGYLDDAHGIVYVYDITEQSSFDVASQFRAHLTEIKSSLPVLFIGNKVDLSHLRQVTTSDAEAFAKQHGWKFVEVSAAVDTESVREAFHDLVRIIRVKEREQGDKPKKKMLRRRSTSNFFGLGGGDKEKAERRDSGGKKEVPKGKQLRKRSTFLDMRDFLKGLRVVHPKEDV